MLNKVWCDRTTFALASPCSAAGYTHTQPHSAYFDFSLATLGARQKLAWLLRLLLPLIGFRQTSRLGIRHMCTVAGVVRHVKTRESRGTTELGNLTWVEPWRSEDTVGPSDMQDSREML
jgi:hypothetical protein